MKFSLSNAVKKIAIGLGIVFALLFAAAILLIKILDIGSGEAIATVAPNSGDTGHAVADGTFIQWWMVKDWDDGRWAEECAILKEAGMKYIVLAPTAFYKGVGTSGKPVTQTIYPTKLKGFEVLRDDKGHKYPDIIDACLRNARKAGMKVFLGLNFSDEWWKKGSDASWIYSRVEEGNQIAAELWEMYKGKYPDAFYGWYWCWEVDNTNFRLLDFNNSKKVLADAIRLQLDYLEKNGMRLPFMIAPYMDWKLGIPWMYAKMWEYVFTNSGMKEGDIFCPQDCIGSGNLKMDNYAVWFAQLRKAVDRSNGISLWVNVETFNIQDWSSATMDRFVKQLNDLKPYVDGIMTFAYSHYYSPGIIDSGFHETYMEYVRTGKLETIPPSAPENLQAAKEDDGTVLLEWSASSDNIGVCGYYVFRNGERIAKLQAGRDDGGEGKKSAGTGIVDKPQAQAGARIIYEVQAYDFAGNLSEKAGPAVVRIAAGMPADLTSKD